MNTRKPNTSIFHRPSNISPEKAPDASPRRFALPAVVVAATAVVGVASASAEAYHPPTHRDSALTSPVAIPTPTPGPPPLPTQEPTTSTASPGTSMTCFTAEPITNGATADVLTIHVSRKLRRSDNTLSEWLIVDRDTNGNASALMPLYVKIRDHGGTADASSTAAHVTQASVPEAVAGALQVPCFGRTPVTIHWHTRPFPGESLRVPLAV
jgi:hypothetical protein